MSSSSSSPVVITPSPTIDDYRRTFPAFTPLNPLLGTFAHHTKPVGELKAREEHVRESWIKAMEARIVRGELQKCYRGEGVNQLQNCKELAEKYAGMIRDNKVCSPLFRPLCRCV